MMMEPGVVSLLREVEIVFRYPAAWVFCRQVMISLDLNKW